MISRTKFLLLSATFQLYPKCTKSNLTFNETKYHDMESVAEKLLPKIRNGLGLINGRCQLCIETIYPIYDEHNVPEMFSTQTQFYTSEQCQVGVIVERMKLLLQNEVTVLFCRDHVTLNVVPASPEEYSTNFKNAPTLFTMTRGYCPIRSDVFDLHLFNGCPSVSLNQENYVSLMQQTRDSARRRDINSLFKFESMGASLNSNTTNFTTQACFESYLSVVSRKNIASAEVPIMTLIFISVLVSNI